ncbi:MAG: serine/threonine protein kinase [Candidatus Obscuribacterales bacterium]|nr:serine/threonine protein kinase [Candidatus Obscuribacterales bacterium]
MDDFLKEGSVFHKRYLIKKKIGGGGMGAVYLAQQTDANRPVALKLLHSELISLEEDRQRFLQEFKMLSSISNDHIVTFYSASISDEGIPYAVCEYIEGRSLRQIISDEERLDWLRTLKIIKQIARAMTVAHEHNIIHRDLKPENIMLLDVPEKDWVKVLDFGLSKFSKQSDASAQQKLTQTGALVGTVNYMSPEQCTGKTLDQRSDIYSLGCIAYECVSGHPLFNADTPLGVLHKHLNESSHNSLHKLRLHCPEQFISVLKTMLEKSPDDRYQSMQELLNELNDNKYLQLTAPRKRDLKTPLLIALALLIAALVSISLISSQTHRTKEDLAIDPSLRVTMGKANEFTQSGSPSKAYDLMKKWINHHHDANDITLAYAWLTAGTAAPDIDKRNSWLSKAKDYFKKHIRSSAEARRGLNRVVEAMIIANTPYDKVEQINEALKDATLCFRKDFGQLTDFHVNIARLATRSVHRKEMIKAISAYVDEIEFATTSHKQLAQLCLQLGDLNALESNAKEAERNYRRARKINDRLRARNEEANVLEAHILRRLVLFEPDKVTALDNFASLLRKSINKDWIPWYIIWGSADERGDMQRAFIYATSSFEADNHNAGELMIAYALEKLSIQFISTNNLAAATPVEYLLKAVQRDNGTIPKRNYCFLLSVSDEAKAHHRGLHSVVENFIKSKKAQIEHKVNERVYLALINPFSSTSKEVLNDPIMWDDQPLWSNFMAAEAVNRIQPEIEKAQSQQDLENILAKMPPKVQIDDGNTYVIQFHGYLLWKFAQKLEHKLRDYKTASKYYKMSVEVLDKRSPHFADGDLSYDNVNWWRIRSKLNQFACDARLKGTSQEHNTKSE